MWWGQFVQVQHIDEKKITWREFKRYFQNEYLTKRYYDKKMKDLFELNLGSMSIDEYERRFLKLLKYVSCIKDEKVKIHRYLSGMSSFISDKIQYDDPKTLEETIRRDKFLYDQQRERPTFQKAWEDKKKIKMEKRKKGTKRPFFRNTSQGQPTPKDPKMTKPMVQRPRKPSIQCWGCGGYHMYRYFHHRGEKVRTSHNARQYMTVEDMGINVPRIYAALDNKQADFQSHMTDVDGKINGQPITILIYSGAIHSYLYFKIVERFKLPRSKLGKPWLVQLATREKRKINEMLKECPMDMNGMSENFDFNIIPLGSYDCLIGMDWLDRNCIVLDCYNKAFTFLDEEGNLITGQGIPRVVTIIDVSALQLKKIYRKGCRVFLGHMEQEPKYKVPNAKYCVVLKSFEDVFK
jgi:hypothetical protein